jgi:hypothetical protein
MFPPYATATKLCIAEKLRKHAGFISDALRCCSFIHPRINSMKKNILSAIGIAAAIGFSASMLVAGTAEAATAKIVVTTPHHHHHHVVHHHHRVVRHHIVKHVAHHHHHRVVHKTVTKTTVKKV